MSVNVGVYILAGIVILWVVGVLSIVISFLVDKDYTTVPTDPRYHSVNLDPDDYYDNDFTSTV